LKQYQQIVSRVLNAEESRRVLIELRLKQQHCQSSFKHRRE
jgi:hypothetical protein